MAQRNEIAAVYVAAVIQGLALVTFPAASTVFTSPEHYGLSSTEYGGMFVPQAITAISASLLGAGLIRRLGIKRIYLLGLTANLVSMALLFLSQFFISDARVAYSMLLLATTSLGIGFGLTVPALNTFTAAFFPQKIDSAVLVLNALLGLGTVLAPVFVAVFIGLGIWWGLPVLAVVLLLALLLFSLSLPLRAGTNKTAQGQQGKTALPARFWIFAAFALLYGVCETINGNWASLYMTQRLGASTTLASLALTIFWGTVTAGRILFAATGRWFPEYRTYQALPFVVAVAFVAVAFIPKGDPFLGILAFGLAGWAVGAAASLQLGPEERPLSPPFGSLSKDGIRHRGFWCRSAATESRPEPSHHLRLSGDCGTGHVGAILCRDQTSDRACAERPLRTNMKTSLITKDLALWRRKRKEKANCHHEVIHDLTLAHRG
jgi:fucose permease